MALGTIHTGWKPGGPLRLGGVTIPHERGAVGHSDADVLLHAIVDALLGAASMGDIGELFPDTDPANRGRDSATMVQAVCQRLRGEDYRIVNVDCIVFLQRPKLGHHKDAMRLRIAELLEIPAHDVGSESENRRRSGCRWAARRRLPRSAWRCWNEG